MKRHQNLLLIIAVVLLAALPLWLVKAPEPDADGKVAELFTGADDKAKNLIGEIAPDYLPWFKPLIEPASGEIASLLFALQAALGAGVIGFYLGSALTRERMRREFEQQREEKSTETLTNRPAGKSPRAD
ncbi:MAG: energy-coupling factor ABC transporter substrate-binding protein [Betaproteobacteria bacterium]